MAMTPEAKELLSRTIRGLHDVLIPEMMHETARVYQLGLAAKDARLDEATARKRGRLEAFLAEQARASSGKRARSAFDYLQDVVKQAASTLVNRLVVLRLLEARSRRRNPVLFGGQTSQAYLDFVAFAPPLADDPQHDDSRGYEFLLGLVFEELSVDLPGLFGPAGIADLIVTPWPTLHDAIKAFGQPALESCWTDDMTLGWVYQYWNDPDREALDAELKKEDSRKVQPHEIASKTQMFTERYMVDWLLQNSLGPLWLAICKKHGWTPAIEANGTLANLEARRVEWRGKRERGDVPLTALMPLRTDAERRWAYYVSPPLPEETRHARESIRDIKILDPAVGSGHFLVLAFEQLVALYREEARHRGEEEQERWSDRAIAEHILENNLHGIDIDPRAVQIAAAALWLKAREFCAEAHPRHLNLVASNLRLAGLPKNDPGLAELRATIARDTGIPPELTDKIVEGLGGADYLGSLLRVDEAVEDAIDAYENPSPKKGDPSAQTDFLATFAEVAKKNILEGLEAFLGKHTTGDDLGLRLRGEQLTAGVRFIRMVHDHTYDLVVANPPYLGLAKLSETQRYFTAYPKCRTDLFAGFYQRGIELTRTGGFSAFITLSNWLFIRAFTEFRQLLRQNHIYALADLGKAAFSTGGTLISTCCAIVKKVPGDGKLSLALRPHEPAEIVRDEAQPLRTQSALLLQRGKLNFIAKTSCIIDTQPMIYWWTERQMAEYASAPKLGELFEVRQGLCTGDNVRALRCAWEVMPSQVIAQEPSRHLHSSNAWMPFMKGGKGRAWVEPLLLVVNWRRRGLEIRVGHEAGFLAARPQNEAFYLRRGVAVQTTGTAFASRMHRYASIFGDKARSVFPAEEDLFKVVALLNSRAAREMIQSLNPTIDFTVGDLKRLPFAEIAGFELIEKTILEEFSEHEARRETSVEFRRPGPSPWRHAQDWAQTAVDRSESTPFPLYTAVYDPEPASDHLSFALGVALGRFGADGQGILDPTADVLSGALPHGICFLDTTLGPNDLRDSLGHVAARPLLTTWDEHGPPIAKGISLRSYLAHKFFDLHRKMYDGRPIHWPLSSEKRTFVAWITIHRWDIDTLRHLLADHLYPARARLEGELPDLRAACDGKDKKAVRAAQKRLEVVQKAREELTTFIEEVEQCAEKGPPPPEPTLRRRADDDHADLKASILALSAATSTLLAPAWMEPAASEGTWDTATLDKLLAVSFRPALALLEGELPALRAARGGAEGRLADVLKARGELLALIATMEQRIGQHRRPAREVDARYAPALDDGVRVNSAALWPLLLPQWKEPKKWWSEIAMGEGKGYDWSRLAMRYWPRFVDAKCQKDPSLAVAHGCFWHHHPARAWLWELRLQDEVAPAFRIEEEPYRGDGGHEAHRMIFLADHPNDALQIAEKEVFRRVRKHGSLQPSIKILESGLWTNHPNACWALELRVLKRYRKILRKKRKEGLPVEDLPNFRLIAPDEPAARGAILAAFPEEFARRRQLLEAELDLEIEDDEELEEIEEDDEDSGTVDEDVRDNADEEDDDA